MTIVLATFIGHTNHLGYVKGQSYELVIEGNHIMRRDGTGFCPYGSVRAFVRNWNMVRLIVAT